MRNIGFLKIPVHKKEMVSIYCNITTNKVLFIFPFLTHCICNRAWLVEGDFLRLFFVEERLSMTWFWIELLLWEMNFSFPFESLWGVTSSSWMMVRSVGLMDCYCIFVENIIIFIFLRQGEIDFYMSSMSKTLIGVPN